MGYNGASNVMRKTQLLKISTILLIGIFCLSSCEKDGVFNPKKKISKIYVQYDGDAKELAETWTWDKDKLVQIDLKNGLFNIPIKFEYDGKQLSKINIGENLYTKCIYKGAKLDKMETYLENTLASVNTFEYKGGKISKITATIYPIMLIKSNETKMVNVLRFVLPQQFSGNMEQLSQNKNDEKGSETTLTSLLTWKGNNVEKMVSEENPHGTLLTRTVTYTYDNKKSPLYGLLYSSSVSSENNVTKETINTAGNIIEHIYSYTYEDNYPKEAKEITILGGEKYTTAYYYEYVK